MTPAPLSQTVSVIIPVKDGARWLAESLAAVEEQRDAGTDVLVADSGSTDGSVAIARDAGARVLEIAPEEFGHGRTRNFAAEHTEGELICFLTQDATPCPGWLEAYREAMAMNPRVGVAFGPQLPRAGAPPMIARGLQEYFGGFGAPGGPPRVFPAGLAPFISNVNACYRRTCWSALRFQDVPFAEDRAFARELSGSGWLLAYHPRAAVLHSHDFGPVTFIRRYFDEFRGLRAVDGFVEPFGVRSKWPEVRTQVERDRAWMRDQGMSGAAVAAWTARSYFHHATRKAAMVAGTHPERIPVFLRRAISLERGPIQDVPNVPRVVTSRGPSPWETVLTFARDGPAPLADPVPGMARAKRLHIAVVVPPFTRGSGGHTAIFRLVKELDKRGHTVSTWLHDPEGRMASKSSATVADELCAFFGAPRGPVFDRFDEWSGADVALATGWDTAYLVARLERCRARAYLVQDREAEFFATSAQALWADASYEAGLEPIVTSRWLAEVVASGIGRVPPVVEAGIDHDAYRLRDVRRRNDTVIFYARAATPRRAVPLGLLALAELHRRRPNTRFALFGHDAPLRVPFPYDHVGVASPAELAEHYAVATVGLCLSLTNRSFVPDEMLACGLPCVELAAPWSAHEAGGPLVLVEPDPLAIAGALEHLLDDPGERARRAEAGLAAIAGRTWEGASRQLEAALRDILKAREAGSR